MTTTLILWLCLGATCVQESVPYIYMTLHECQRYGPQIAAMLLSRPAWQGWRLTGYECSSGETT